MFYKKCPLGFLKSEVVYWKHEEAWSTYQLPTSRKKENMLVQTIKKANLVQKIKEIPFQIDRYRYTHTHTQTYNIYFGSQSKQFEKQGVEVQPLQQLPGKSPHLSSKKQLYFNILENAKLGSETQISYSAYNVWQTGKSIFIINLSPKEDQTLYFTRVRLFTILVYLPFQF